MKADRKKQFNELRKRLAALTEKERIEFVAQAGGIVTVDGRTLSRNNTILLLMQSNGVVPAVVGGYRQWQKVKRQVRKGEHGLMLWYPSQKKVEAGEDKEDIRFYIGTIFDISQTEEMVGIEEERK